MFLTDERAMMLRTTGKRKSISRRTGNYQSLKTKMALDGKQKNRYACSSFP